MCTLAIALHSAMSLLLFTKASGFGMSKLRTQSSSMRVASIKMSTAPEMDYVNLGSSDLKVSKVCLGTMTWGQQNTMAEGIEQLDVAFNEYGINFLDTAEMYPVPTKPETQGETDRVIAKWLVGRDRSKVIIASKVSGASERITWLPGRNGAGARVSKKDIIVSVDESLKRLGTDYLDLVQIHWPDRYVPLFGGAAYDQKLEREYYSFEEQLRAFDDLIKAGKVRHVGVSNETPYGVMKFAQASEKYGLPRMVSIQNSYSLLVRSDYESGLTEVCSPSNENVGLLAYSPLCGGILTGKYASEDCPKTSRLNLFEGLMPRYKQSIAQDAVSEYSEIAKKNGLTPTELALSWCYNQQHVTSTIIGATSVPQLRENLNSYGKKHLVDDKVVAAIENVYKRYRDPSRI